MSRKIKYRKGRDRRVAAFLSLFLGGVGVQKFYLGNIFMGVLCAVFSFTIIPFIIGGIDFLRFVLMDDEEFDRRYNGNGFPVHRTKYGTIVFKKDERVDTGPARPFNPPVYPTRERTFSTQKTKQKSVPLSSNSKYNEGNEFFEKYSIKSALECYQAALKETPDSTEIYFKMACCNALLEQKNAMFENIKMALRWGFKDYNRIRTQDELAYFRIQPEYDKINQSDFTQWPEIQEESDSVKDELNNRAEKPKTIEEEKTPELSTDEILEQLKELGDLHQQGVLSDSEFNVQKRKLLA